jgi:hypothetical protein
MSSAIKLASAIVVILALVGLIIAVLWPGQLTGVMLPALLDALRKSDD